MERRRGIARHAFPLVLSAPASCSMRAAYKKPAGTCPAGLICSVADSAPFPYRLGRLAGGQLYARPSRRRSMRKAAPGSPVRPFLYYAARRPPGAPMVLWYTQNKPSFNDICYHLLTFTIISIHAPCVGSDLFLSFCIQAAFCAAFGTMMALFTVRVALAASSAFRLSFPSSRRYTVGSRVTHCSPPCYVQQVKRFPKLFRCLAIKFVTLMFSSALVISGAGK